MTNKREIENYIHPDAIQEAFNISITFSDTCDVPNILSNQVNLDATNPFYRLRSSRAKKILNEFATKRMTLARINAIDTSNEIENWLRQIATITRVWQKWRFSAPQTHLWLIEFGSPHHHLW